jgi:DNA-binding NtrC family response regulator
VNTSHELDLNHVDVSIKKASLAMENLNSTWCSNEEVKIMDIPSRNSSKARVLLVEASPLLSLEYEQTLNRAGYCVVASTSTIKGALEALENSFIDIVVLDTHVKDGQTHELAKALKTRGIPFLLLSDSSSEEVLQEDFKDFGFLPKPVGDDELIHELQLLLGSSPKEI